MTQDQFIEELRTLFDQARAAQVMPLRDLIDNIDAEVNGLRMALDEGEEF